MSSRIIPSAIPNPVTPLVWDGSDFRALPGSTGGIPQFQPRGFKTYAIFVAPDAVAAGATRTEVNIAGNGFFIAHSHHLAGAALAAAQSKVNVYIDGEGVPSISLRCNGYVNDALSFVYGVAPLYTQGNNGPVGWASAVDITNFIFSGGLYIPSYFKTNLAVTITNGDGVNPTTIKSTTLYALWT